MVAAARFPPKGIRGFGSPFTQTAWGISVVDYLAQANDGIVVMTQVETVDAVKNLDEILTVDGLGEHATAEGGNAADLRQTVCLLDRTIYLWRMDTRRRHRIRTLTWK